MKNVLLIILDGFGEGKAYPGNAVHLAKTPILTELRKKYPWTLLKASGKAVGIPEGTQGGSEVGHFTIGAGRVIFQSLGEINRSIADESFFEKKSLRLACERVKKGDKSALHLLGMISDQGVHSDIRHLFALLELAKREKVSPVFIHAITDGRDVPEQCAAKYIQQIQNKIRELGLEKVAKIATIVGRYYAMDRDSNWDRIKAAYDLYTRGVGIKETDPISAIEHAYKRGIETDYYIDPIVIASPDAQSGRSNLIQEKDSVIFWNFRTDRARQLTRAFTGESRPFFVCFGPYSEKAPVVFPTPIVKNNLGAVISRAGLKQFRIAETEKYAHVTYFFNSQIEVPFPGEDRLMIDSKKCHSYAEKPEMSAREITDALLLRLAKQDYSLIVLNFANCDLVGHSGDLKASIKAVEVIDECVGRIIPIAQKNGYVTLITGDHGNVEYKIYEENGQPCPSHTMNPVPCIVIASLSNHEKRTIRQAHGDIGGELQDIAPTILEIMGIPKPKEMTGVSLLKK